MFRDNYYSFKASWFYSTTTVAYMSLLILMLLFSDAYLYVGSISFLPVNLLLVSAEFIKYIYIHVNYRIKDNSYNQKHSLKLIGVMYNILKGVRILTLIRSMVMLTVFTFLVYFFTVLFGAECLNKFEETFMFSCLITVLVTFPIFLHEGMNTFMAVLYNNMSERVDPFGMVFVRNFTLTLFGAWLGAFVIPLDWGRKWQVWPVPCSLGAMVGFDLAQINSIIDLHLKHPLTTAKLKGKFR